MNTIHRLSVISAILACAIGAFAQQANINLTHNPQKDTEGLIPFSASLNSPQVNDDHTVIFRIKAPKAKEVLLSGAMLTVMGEQKPIPFTMGKDGIWTLEIGPLPVDMYQYNIIVDGVSMADPNNTCAAFTAMPPYSELIVHGDGPQWYDARDVEHGAVTRHVYYSPVTEGQREMYAYTPAGYDPDKPYPVLYLMGGSGELPSNWMYDGRVNFIMDNLLAEGRAVPMIIAIVNNQVVHRNHPQHADLTFDIMRRELKEVIVPYVDSHYNTIANPHGRALSGLSMGGRHTMYSGLTSLDTFANFGILSAGDNDAENTLKDFLNDPKANEKIDYLFVGQGTGEQSNFFNVRVKGLIDALNAHGIEHEYYVGGHGAHDWSTWRHLLYYRFVPSLFRTSATDNESLNPILPDFHADPEILYSNKTGKYYIYSTTDGVPGWGGTYYMCFSSPDLKKWTDEGIVLDLATDQVAWANGNCWAPAIEEKKIGDQNKYFLYFSGQPTDGGGKAIGVAVADSPTGPFVDSGAPIVDRKPDGVKGGQQIDVDVFTDPVSGKSYLYWGNGYMAGAELNDDMVSIKSETITVMTPKGGKLADYAYREAPYVFYRDGKYYCMWSVDDTGSPNYHVAYGTMESPLGQITVADDPIVLIGDLGRGIYGTAHNSVLQIPGTDDWRIVYHRINPKYIGKDPGVHREVCIDRMAFNPDGTIKRVTPTAPDPKHAKFEREYREMMDSMQIVGISMAVVKDNDIVYTHEFGYKDLESLEPVQNNTLFRIASISKSFTVTTLMQLYEQGLIDITADVSQYLPFTLRNPKYPDVPITIEMMMSHTSSINDSQGYYTNYDPINPDLSGADVAKCYNDYAPGTGYEYCNYNTNLLACVIENVTGRPWFEYVAEHVLKPLDIDGGYNVDKLDRNRFATLYAWDGKEYNAQPEAYQRPDVLDNYELCVNSPRLSAAGGMKITATDLAKYMLMHMNYGKSPRASERVISEESSRRMQTVISDDAKAGGPDRDHAGLGLMRSSEFTPGVELVGHTGGAYGLRSAMFFEPEKKFGFVVICNGTTSRSILQNSLTRMYEHFIGPLPK